MKAALALWTALTGIAQAQFYGLAPGEDGAQLYFNSGLPLRGSGLEPANRIYRLDTNGVTLFAQASPSASANTSVDSLNVSRDGSVLSYVLFTSTPILNLPPIGNSQITENTVVLGPGGTQTQFNGAGSLSRNGRFLVLRNSDGAALADLSTGAITPIPMSVAAGQMVTDAGTVAGFSGTSIVLWSPGGQTTFDASDPVETAFVSADGARVIYETERDYVWTLWSLNPNTGQPAPLATGDVHSYQPSLSDDGNTILYLAGDPKQVWTEQADGTGQLQLSNAGEGISAAAVAGNGQTGYAASFWSRLLKFDLASGAATQVFDPLPSIGSAGQPLVPGSAATIRGITGLAPAAINGLTVTVNGVPAPLLQATASQITYQLPWEVDPQSQPSIVVSVPPPDNPFGGPFSFDPAVSYFWPVLEDLAAVGALNVSALHDDGSLATPDRPASAAEELHVFMSGLGTVTPRTGTGSAAPAGPLSLTLAPIECDVAGSGGGAAPAEVTFAGLAPGQIGIYQVNFRLPPSFAMPLQMAGTSYLSFACGLAGATEPRPSEAIFVQ